MALSIPKQLKSWTRQGIDVTQVMVASQAAIDAAAQAQAALAALLDALENGTIPGGPGPGTGDVVDATTTVKGKIKLGGDLDGTADAPTVPRLNTISQRIDGLAAPQWPIAGTPSNLALLDINGRIPLNAMPTTFLAIQGDGSVTVPIRYNYQGMVAMITSTEPPRTGELTGGTAALAPKDLWFSTAP